MSRSLSSTTITALSSSVVYPFFAVDLDLDSGPVYMWNGLGDLVIGSKTYLGAGDIMNISSITETSEMSAQGAEISISGIQTAFLSLSLQEPYQGRQCRIYFGMTATPSDYNEIFSGFLDQMTIQENFDTATITISIENELIRLERPVVRRLTSEDQKSRYPNDKGLEFIADLQNKEIFWGRKS